jgi:hypothetical protein
MIPNFDKMNYNQFDFFINIIIDIYPWIIYAQPIHSLDEIIIARYIFFPQSFPSTGL